MTGGSLIRASDIFDNRRLIHLITAGRSDAPRTVKIFMEIDFNACCSYCYQSPEICFQYKTK